MMIRDERSKAILNIDEESLNKYKRERDQIRKINLLFDELKEVKNKLAEILQLIEKSK
jgi:hypothetical protein